MCHRVAFSQVISLSPPTVLVTVLKGGLVRGVGCLNHYEFLHNDTSSSAFLSTCQQEAVEGKRGLFL